MSENEPKDEARFFERIDASWQPEPLDEAGRSRFDARLRERLAAASGRRAGGWLLPAASALAVVALAWWGFQARGPADVPADAVAWRVAEWEWDLLLGGELEGVGEEASALPEEYAAIASVFLNP